MNVREGIAFGVAFLGFAAAGILGWQQAGLNRELAAQQARAAQREGKAAELGKRLALAEKALEAARTEGAARQREAETAQEALKAVRQAAEEKLAALGANAPAPAPAEAPKKKKKGGMAGMMAMTRKMMDNPVAKEQLRKGMSLQIEMLYKELFEELHLEGAVREKLAEILLNRLLGRTEIGMLVFDEDMKEDEILRQQQEAFTKTSAALAGLLSADQLARLKEYEKGLSEKMQSEQLDQELAALRIQPVQQEPVRSIVLEEQKAMQSRVQARFGAMSGSDGPVSVSEISAEQIRQARRMMSGEGIQDVDLLLKDLAATTQRTLERVQPLLTPEQYETFKKQQEAKVQMMEMSLRMMDAMGGD